MAQINLKEIVYCGDKYYSYNEELYTATFPKEWAENHLEGTGPNDCKNCADYGSWNGVFIGYCANCAQYTYNGERGCGFISNGYQLDDDDCLGINVFSTYLKHISQMDDIGDKDFCDSAQMIVADDEPIVINEWDYLPEAFDEMSDDMPELIENFEEDLEKYYMDALAGVFSNAENYASFYA